MSISREDEQDAAEEREDALLRQLAEYRHAIQVAARLIKESNDCHEQDRREGRVDCYPMSGEVALCGWCRDVAAWCALPAVVRARGEMDRE